MWPFNKFDHCSFSLRTGLGQVLRNRFQQGQGQQGQGQQGQDPDQAEGRDRQGLLDRLREKLEDLGTRLGGGDGDEDGGGDGGGLRDLISNLV